MTSDGDDKDDNDDDDNENNPWSSQWKQDKSEGGNDNVDQWIELDVNAQSKGHCSLVH